MPDLHESLEPYATALHQVGFHVRVPKTALRDRRGEGFFYISADGAPGLLILSKSGFPLLGEPPTLSVPIQPNRDFGSGVLIDFDGTPAHLVTVVTARLKQTTVMTRFFTNNEMVAVDTRIPFPTYDWQPTANIAADHDDQVQE